MTSGEPTGNRTYLTFTLDGEDFAVDVAGVREVLDYTTVTRVPRTPDFMKGVINLRGSVVPVVDMRLKFGMPEAGKTVDTCVIVLEVEMDGEITVIGAIADSVKEVFELPFEDIEPPPRLGTRLETEFISGMGKHNEEFIIILDVDKIFSDTELALFRQADGDANPPSPGAEPDGDPPDGQPSTRADGSSVGEAEEPCDERQGEKGVVEKPQNADKQPPSKKRPRRSTSGGAGGKSTRGSAAPGAKKS